MHSGQIKSDKELKPASLRVKEAAECVLCFLMEHAYLSPSLPSSSTSTIEAIDERTLSDSNSRPTKFRYFALDGSLIMAITDKWPPAASNSFPSPNVTVIMRGAFSRQSWSLNLRTASFATLDTNKQVRTYFSVTVVPRCKRPWS
jgi:hypothetical protein